MKSWKKWENGKSGESWGKVVKSRKIAKSGEKEKVGKSREKWKKYEK